MRPSQKRHVWGRSVCVPEAPRPKGKRHVDHVGPKGCVVHDVQRISVETDTVTPQFLIAPSDFPRIGGGWDSKTLKYPRVTTHDSSVRGFFWEVQISGNPRT